MKRAEKVEERKTAPHENSFLVLRDNLLMCVVVCVSSISFNCDSSLMCVASDHGTIHVFAIDETHKNKQSR